MYDTVLFYTKRGKEDIKHIIDRLRNPKEETDLKTGEVLSCKGTYKNLYVRITPTHIFISGSLAKFQNGNNIEMFSRLQAKDAIEHISDVFLIDMGKANVSGLDFSATIEVNNPTIEYLSLFGSCDNLVKIIFPTTLYYQSITKTKTKPLELCIYDKMAEASGSCRLPIEHRTVYLLRYELKLRQRLGKRFGVAEVLGSTLFTPCFYQQTITMWAEYYDRIEKHSSIKSNFIDNIQRPDDAWNVFIASLIANADRGLFDAYLKDLKKNKVFGRPGDYSRLKNKFKQISSNKSYTDSQDLIIELDSKIQNIKNNWD